MTCSHPSPSGPTRTHRKGQLESHSSFACTALDRHICASPLPYHPWHTPGAGGRDKQCPPRPRGRPAALLASDTSHAVSTASLLIGYVGSAGEPYRLRLHCPRSAHLCIPAPVPSMAHPRSGWPRWTVPSTPAWPPCSTTHQRRISCSQCIVGEVSLSSLSGSRGESWCARPRPPPFKPLVWELAHDRPRPSPRPSCAVSPLGGSRSDPSSLTHVAAGGMARRRASAPATDLTSHSGLC